MRDTVIRELINLGKEDKNLTLITGDLGFGVLRPFWETLPDQFFNAGITEQSMTPRKNSASSASRTPARISLPHGAGKWPIE